MPEAQTGRRTGYAGAGVTAIPRTDSGDARPHTDGQASATQLR